MLLLRALSFSLNMVLMPVLFLATLQYGMARGWAGADAVAERLPSLPFVAGSVVQATGPGGLASAIQEALAQGEVEDAVSLLDLARQLGQPVPQPLAAQVEQARNEFDALPAQAGRFADGFISGEAEDGSGIAGAILSDLTVIGDVRDIAREGGKLMDGKPYSQFILGLSVVGLVATAATIASAGTSSGARIGLSIAKLAKRTGRMTAGLTADTVRVLSRAVDFNKIRRSFNQADLVRPQALRRGLTEAVDLKAAKPLTRAGGDMADMASKVGVSDTLRLVSKANSLEDIGSLSRLTSRFGKATRGLVKITGRVSVRAFKTATALVLALAVYSWWALAGFGGWLFSFLAGSFLVSALFGGRKRKARHG